jgi:hypothetical protein
MLKYLGFRYSESREGYILRGIGRHIGPVFKPRDRSQSVSR